jgi:hypothetical protein
MAAAHSDGFYLHQFLQRLQALEARLVARLPESSALPARASALRHHVEKAVMSMGDTLLDQLLENVFLPELDRLMFDVREALQLTQHARKVKGTAISSRQARLLQLGATLPDEPEVPLFKAGTPPKRDPKNKDKIEDALRRLKDFLT